MQVGTDFDYGENGMRAGDDGPDEMQTLRELLLGPLFEQNKIRDQKSSSLSNNSARI
jgi:hypothetical protein